MQVTARPGSGYLFFGLAVGVGVAALDQLTKWVILYHVMVPPRAIEVTGFFNLVLVWNTGISFGMFSDGAPEMRFVLIALALAISGALIVWLRRAESRFLALAIGLVLGGASGNVVDRLVYGAVADFLDFHAFGYHWPAFNVADAAICIGVALLLIDGLFAEKAMTK